VRCQNLVQKLYRGLRAGLIVMKDEIDRLPVDAAALIDAVGKAFQRCFLALAVSGSITLRL